MKILHGHTSPETAFVVDNYPYGYKLRCKIRYWIEKASKGKGKGQYRFCSQTLNPKTKKWNAPKYSIYSTFMIMGIEDNGYITHKTLTPYDNQETINKFLTENKDELSESERDLINKLLDTKKQVENLIFKISARII
jgi:hypothetical protein